MRSGRIIGLGRPDHVLTPSLLRAAYGVDVCVLPGPDGHPVVLPLPTGLNG